jgi:hypothetical protein
VPAAGALGDRGERVQRLDGREGDALVAVQHHEERGHAELVGQASKHRLGRSLQIGGDAPCERRDVGADQQ